MPPKKKLSPEEKKALRIAKKQEKKRRTEERKLQIKRDQLHRELAYSAYTTKRHEREWRKMLMKIALPRMKDELQFAWNNFERIVDCKDFAISLLMDELKDAEEQYMMNYRNHMENIEKLMEMFRDRLSEFKEDYNKQIQTLYDEMHKQMDFLNSQSAVGEEYLKQMIYGLEMQQKEQEKLLKVEYISRLDDQELRYGDIIQRLRAYLENFHAQLWTKTEEFLKEYFHKTKERRKAHDALKTQDDTMQELIQAQLTKLTKAQETIKKLKEKLYDVQRISGMKINDLEIERKFFADAFLTLKLRLEQDRKVDEQKLRMMTVESLKAINLLEDVKKRGEHILEQAAICRKLETQKEKILPFPSDITKYMKLPQEDHSEKIENLDTRLTLFWQRVGQANGLRFGINEEKIFLELENRMLEREIHSHQCSFCTKMAFKKSRYGTINVTEGKDMLKKYRIQKGVTFEDSDK